MVMRVGVYVSLLAGLFLTPVLLSKAFPAWAQGAESAVALTLREAVDMALRRIERSSMKIAQWHTAEERGSLWPSLALRGRYARDSATLVQQSGGAVVTGETFQRYVAELALNYNLLEFLAAYPRVREAQADERTALLRLREEEANTALRTSDAYLRLLAKWEAQRALEALQDEYREFFLGIEERFQLQIIPAIEHTRARSQKLAMEREILNIQNEAIAAELELRRLAGLKPEQALHLSFDERDVNVAVIKSTGLAGLLASAQEANPRLLTAEAAIATARWHAEGVRSAYYPTVSLSVSGGFGRDEILGAGVSAGSASGLRYNVSSVLSLPLFDGGVRQARLAQATARVESQMREANRAEVEIKQLIEEGYWAFVEKEHERDQVQQQVQLTEEEFQQARERTAEGITMVNDVLSAFAKLVRLRQELAHVRSDALLKGIRLSLAVGWYPFMQGTPPQSAPSEPVAALRLAAGMPSRPTPPSSPGANPAKPASQTGTKPELPVLKETVRSAWQPPGAAQATKPYTPVKSGVTPPERPVLQEVIRPAWQPQAPNPYTPVSRALPPSAAPAKPGGTRPELPVLKEVVRPAWQPHSTLPAANVQTPVNQTVTAPQPPAPEEVPVGARSGRSGSFTVPSAVRGLP